MNKGLSAIGIVCKDLESSINFYSLLGLNFEKVGDDHYEAKMPNGLFLMLDSVELIKKINPHWNEAAGSSIVLCFKQEDSTQVDELFSKLVTSGAEEVKRPWDAFWGQYYSSVKDPDGNQIDIFSDTCV